ncbi:hypothetical protein FA15DRAFT_759329 [Coprinopsis marcescibilis]|uniref:Uncharacterized protein n=1 Tax=Coprinopsis marcescibilis TaxID=230819 RepID=A0A5C3KK48_COPMA|nr:hypothetical protein FA15DRAFT_759329 [Coprinopsis marcescibilis]
MRLTQTLFRALQHPILDRHLQDSAAMSMGVAIVRKVMREHATTENGLRTKDIYELALKEPAPQDFQTVLPISNIPTPPPHPEHPIRSKVFLKEVLSHLEGYRDIRLVREVKPRENSTVTDAVFLWKLVDKSLFRKPQEIKPQKPTLSKAIGGHDDWSHLNKRRQRGRRAKILTALREFKGKPVDLSPV